MLEKTLETRGENLVRGMEHMLADMKRGLSAKQSAGELGLSPRTVEKLRAHLRQRYGVHNATSLMNRITGLPD